MSHNDFMKYLDDLNDDLLSDPLRALNEDWK